jgi:carbohydrate-binding DOMON domain-containing protein
LTETSGTTTVPATVYSTVTGTTTGQTATATTTLTHTSQATTSQTITIMYTATGAARPNAPPIPGFPLESILAGLGLGLLAVHLIYRNRRVNRKL